MPPFPRGGCAERKTSITIIRRFLSSASSLLDPSPHHQPGSVNKNWVSRKLRGMGGCGVNRLPRVPPFGELKVTRFVLVEQATKRIKCALPGNQHRSNVGRPQPSACRRIRAASGTTSAGRVRWGGMSIRGWGWFGRSCCFRQVSVSSDCAVERAARCVRISN